MIDIILPVYNNIKYTKLFIESLLLQKNIKYNLIVIDNWSSDGTKDFLLAQKNITIIHNKKNLWYIKAVNQGMSISKNKVILLCNNDIILPENVIYRMKQKLLMFDMVAPMTNSINWKSKNILLVEYEWGTSLSDINKFSKKIWNEHKGIVSNVDYVYWHCMMFTREVKLTVWNLDEIFGLWNYDDIDFCMRTKNAWFKIWLLNGLFVYHFCHTTFKKMWLDVKKLNDFNRAKFNNKWS